MKIAQTNAPPNNARFRIETENPKTKEPEIFFLDIDLARLTRKLAARARCNKSRTAQIGADAVVIELQGKPNV
jgi:hypothetical protein